MIARAAARWSATADRIDAWIQRGSPWRGLGVLMGVLVAYMAAGVALAVVVLWIFA